MNRLILLALICLVFWSCNNIDRPEKPENLLSESQMVDIITDISILNAAKGSNYRIIKEKGVIPEEYIYKKYNIDSVQFAESSEYYAYNIKTYENIYTKVKQRLNKRKAETTELEEKKKKERDSIRESKKSKRDSIRTIKLPKKTEPGRPLKKERKSPQ